MVSRAFVGHAVGLLASGWMVGHSYADWLLRRALVVSRKLIGQSYTDWSVSRTLIGCSVMRFVGHALASEWLVGYSHADWSFEAFVGWPVGSWLVSRTLIGW